MSRIILSIFLLGLLLTLEACSSGHQTLKAPCPPLLGFGSPCEEIPLNQVDL